MDKQSIFRRESLDRVESPEQLDAYIKVSHPKVWLIMAALLVAVISVIVWSVVGSLPQTMTVKGVTVGGNVINCYECVENANTNLIGCKANITCALTNSLGFGGHNASLLIKKYVEE